jgi:hypothetical protein
MVRLLLSAKEPGALAKLIRLRTTIVTGRGVKACVVDTHGKIDLGLRRLKMLWTIFVILLVLWLVGLVSSYTLGGFIHLLLVAAVVVLILQLISGRRVV